MSTVQYCLIFSVNKAECHPCVSATPSANTHIVSSFINHSIHFLEIFFTVTISVFIFHVMMSSGKHSLFVWEHWKDLFPTLHWRVFFFKRLVTVDSHLITLKHTAATLYTQAIRCCDWLVTIWLTGQSESTLFLLWHHQDSNSSPPDDRFNL